MMSLIRRRAEVEKADKTQDHISKYMFHYHSDYSHNLEAIINLPNLGWGDVIVFKNYCFSQLDKYLSNDAYDALAICVALREIVEKHCATNLPPDKLQGFMEERGTPAKMNYSISCGVEVPDLFFMLGLLYNDPLHPNDRHGKDMRHVLYSRLENNVIKGMVKNLKKTYWDAQP